MPPSWSCGNPWTEPKWVAIGEPPVAHSCKDAIVFEEGVQMSADSCSHWRYIGWISINVDERSGHQNPIQMMSRDSFVKVVKGDREPIAQLMIVRPGNGRIMSSMTYQLARDGIYRVIISPDAGYRCLVT
jgi:hypothetical protein